MKQTLSLSISKLSFASSEDRTNWMTFSGTCAFVDQPCDGVPSGGIDKPVAFPRSDMTLALPTFVDMGVNCRYDDYNPDQMFEGHDSQFKIGVVKTADITGNEVIISGGLWSYDFGALCDKVKSAKESLGWSIEVLMVLTDKGDYYEATEIEFVGVALMWADKAAFKKTYMAAQLKENKGGISMNEVELKAMFAELKLGISKVVNDSIEGVKLEFAEQIGAVSKGVSEGFAKIDADKVALALQAETEKADVEAKAKLALEAKVIQDAKDAEDVKVALALAAKAAEDEVGKRQTLQFGVRVGKFEGDDEAQKAIVANAKLSPQEQFRKLIELKLQQGN